MNFNTKFINIEIDINSVCEFIKNFPDKDYINSEICAITGLSNRQVRFYTGKVVKPMVKGAGRGNFNKYSKKNIVEFLLIKDLSEYGVTIEKMRKIVNESIKNYEIAIVECGIQIPTRYRRKIFKNKGEGKWLKQK